MKLENIVCDIEYAKKLKELGVKQDSLFYWCANIQDQKHCNLKAYTESLYKDDIILEFNRNGSYKTVYWKDVLTGLDDKIYDYIDEHQYKFVYSAFTCAELLKLLSDLYIEIELLDKEFRCEVNIINGYAITNKKLSNALSRMLIYLIENKLITI